MLAYLNRQSVLLRVSVATDANNLPADLKPWGPSCDDELVLYYFSGNENGRKLPNTCELISEVAVEGFKPIRKSDLGLATVVQNRRSTVDIHHVWRLDKRMLEVPVLGIQWMIDPETTT